jgi:hypothetical protein
VSFVKTARERTNEKKLADEHIRQLALSEAIKYDGIKGPAL